MTTVSREKIVESLKKMPLLEVAELVKELEEVFGVSAAAPVSAMVAPAEAATQEEKDSFDVVLAAIGDNKISVIKEVRVITGLGLKEAKELVEGVPKTVKEGASKEEAGKLQQQLEGAGAKVDLK